MSYTYLLVDLPADHEVEGALATECDSIRGILTNKLRGSKVKHVRATTLEGLSKTVPQNPYPHIKYVHLACHGHEDGIGLIGAKLRWSRLAQYLVRYVPPLRANQRRVLSLSCCHSKDGATKMARELKGHFTAAYYLTEPEVGFDTSMVVWSMFYHRKGLHTPLAKVKDRINVFFGDRPLEIRYYDQSAAPKAAGRKPQFAQTIARSLSAAAAHSGSEQMRTRRPQRLQTVSPRQRGLPAPHHLWPRSQFRT